MVPHITSAHHFREHLLFEIQRRTYQVVQGNFDPLVPPIGVPQPGTLHLRPLVDFQMAFLDNSQSFFTTFVLLSDDQSRRLYIEWLLHRMLGYMRVALPANNPGYWEARRRAEMVERTPSQFEGLEHFSFHHAGRAVELDCWFANLLWTFFLDQYVYSSAAGRIAVRPGDHVIDGGTCFGDTAVAMALMAGETGHVYSFDPLGNHLDVAWHNAGQNRISNITYFQAGLSDRVQAAPPIRGVEFSAGFRVAVDETAIPLDTIDNLLASGRIPRVDVIKLDIEGSEVAALLGARETILRHRPMLAISAYHRNDDMATIPALVASIAPDYRFYLEHYTISSTETVLFAVPPDYRLSDP